MSHLKGCPFCGSSDEICTFSGELWEEYTHLVQCGKCESMTRDRASLDSAIYQWNTRHAPPSDNGFQSAPARYTQQDRETIDRIRDSMTDSEFIAFCNGTAMRYEDRCGAKGDPEGDAEKARFYRMMADHVAGNGPDPRASRPGFQPYVRIGGINESR